MKFNVRTVGITNNMIDPEVRKANLWLANEVWKTTKPFVPAQTMSLNKKSHVEDTKVVYPGPYARYLYYGKAMVDPATGKGPPRFKDKETGEYIIRWPEGSKLVASSKDLVFSKEVHKSAQAFWFEASKAKNKESWIRGAEKVIKRELNK